MNSTNSLPPKATRYCCNRCGIAAPDPIVKPVANPRFPENGRCANTQACDKRANADVRTARKAKRKDRR